MFGERLKELRNEKELSQEELGKLLQKTKNNISQYELGKREPDIETINKLSEILGVSTDYLLGKSEYRNGRLVSVEELKEFLPSDFVDKHKINVLVDELKLKDSTKQEIIEVLKKNGYDI